MGLVDLGRIMCQGGITHRHVSQLLRKAEEYEITDDKRLNIITAAHSVIQKNPAVLKNCLIRMTDEDLKAELVSGNGGTIFEINKDGVPEKKQIERGWLRILRDAFVTIWQWAIKGWILGTIVGASKKLLGRDDSPVTVG